MKLTWFMGGLSALLGLAAIGGIVLAAGLVFWMILRAVLWLVLLPFRLLFWLLFLPFLLVKTVLLSVGGLLLGLLFVVAGVLVALGLAAVTLPLLPIAVLIIVTWALVRLMKRPATT